MQAEETSRRLGPGCVISYTCSFHAWNPSHSQTTGFQVHIAAMDTDEPAGHGCPPLVTSLGGSHFSTRLRTSSICETFSVW